MPYKDRIFDLEIYLTRARDIYIYIYKRLDLPTRTVPYLFDISQLSLGSGGFPFLNFLDRGQFSFFKTAVFRISRGEKTDKI